MGRVIQYVSQPKKTMDEEGNRYLTGVNCVADVAMQSFMATKHLYGKALGAGELDPVDLIGRERAVGGVHHTNLDPVRAGFGHRAGAVFPVLGKSHRRKRHRPVVRERIGIEEHLALRTGGRRTVEH